jgi:hypothetical protein
MALSILKAGAIAATALILSATSSMAAVYGTIEYDVKVKKTWSSNSQTVWWLDEGDYVKVINYTSKNGGWYRVDPPGANNAGWIKDSAIDLDVNDFDDDDDVDLTICGPTLFFGGNFCISN